MNEGKELIKALDDIEKEKGISKDILLEAIENSLVAACKNEYGIYRNHVPSIHASRYADCW